MPGKKNEKEHHGNTLPAQHCNAGKSRTRVWLD